MRVTVNLTDEQAEHVLFAWKILEPNGYVLSEVCCAFRDAIAAARPKPLAIGDYVKWGRCFAAPVLGLGTTRGVRWLVVDDESDGPTFSTEIARWKMADGSPIVWPES